MSAISISPELQTLLSASFQVKSQDFSDRYSTDYLRRLMRYHGVRPQFLDFLKKNNLEFDFQTNLSLECQNMAIGNLMSVKELGRVSDLLAGYNIECFAYKGSLWADWLYGDVGKREFGDIDILIESRYIVEALGILEGAGYLPDSYRQYLLKYPKRSKGFFRTDYHIPLENSSSEVLSTVEVHWQVAYPRLCFSFPSDEWIMYKQVYNLHQVALNGFQNEYQFLLLLVHHGGKERWCKLKYIADLAAYMIKHGSRTDWIFIEDIARDKGIHNLFTISLGLLKSLGLSWEVDWPVITKFINPVPYIDIWQKMPKESANSTWPYFIQGLSVHDGLKHKSKVLFQHLTYLFEWQLLIDKIKWYSNDNPKPISD
ncbi:nucleotidyltransferase family protein [Dyadobacter sp. CY356]|uniref:nucleotidyltransferase family protein n=1 Tax=Dyadobacter sp. CY356 TaxID=2906442 RepID=UPI001F30520B|nr:nucleotidyltransferase family protein [Dyadobacter sp. CY356]MCF0057320.1 nucleotidyltransferase family protein [Dyadobacter sp. CY356]